MPNVCRRVAFVLLVETSVLFLRSALQRTLAADGVSEGVAPLLSYLVVAPLFAVMLFPLLRAEWRLLRARLALRRVTLRLLALGVALGLSLRLGYWGGLVASAGFGWTGPDPNAPPGPLIGFFCAPLSFAVLYLLVMALLVPLIEEVVHRGWFLDWLAPYGRRAAVLLSATAFMLYHAPGSMPLAFVFGLYAGVLCWNTGTLWASLVAHATFNGLVYVDWHCLQAIWNPPETTTGSRAVGALGLALAVCATALAALLVSRRVTGPGAGGPPRATRQAVDGEPATTRPRRAR